MRGRNRREKGGREKGREKGGREKGREKGREGERKGKEREGGREKEITLYMLLSLTSQGCVVNRGACIYLNHGLQGVNGLRNAKEFCFFQNTYKTQDTMSFDMTQEDPGFLPRIHLTKLAREQDPVQHKLMA